MNDFAIIPILACGRCLFRSVVSHGLSKLSGAARFENGMIRDSELQTLETALADKLRLEVVKCTEVRAQACKFGFKAYIYNIFTLIENRFLYYLFAFDIHYFHIATY
jgi:hypothetical protein